MKTAAHQALDAATVRGVTYADARVVSIRNRSLTTKNGRVGHASESESLGDRRARDRGTVHGDLPRPRI